MRLEPWVKTRCYHNKYLGEETLARTREAGDRYSTYVNVYGNQPLSVRYQTGFLAWRLGLDTVMIWAWREVGEDFEGTRSTLRDWEATREGIDDLKYLELLEALVVEGRGAPDARADAEALLTELRERVAPNVRKIGYVDGVSGEWVAGDAAWAPAEFDRLRARVAGAIGGLLESEAGTQQSAESGGP